MQRNIHCKGTIRADLILTHICCRLYIAIFEPAHGSAPDIAGRGIANPLSQILSGCMLLRHLGYLTEAQKLEDAVSRVLADGISTTDLGGSSTTKEFVAAVKSQL